MARTWRGLCESYRSVGYLEAVRVRLCAVHNVGQVRGAAQREVERYRRVGRVAAAAQGRRGAVRDAHRREAHARAVHRDGRGAASGVRGAPRCRGGHSRAVSRRSRSTTTSLQERRRRAGKTASLSISMRSCAAACGAHIARPVRLYTPTVIPARGAAHMRLT